MKRGRYLAISSALFSLMLIVPYFSITGFDTVGFDSGSEGELIVGPSPSGTIPTVEIEVPVTGGGTGGGGGSSPPSFNLTPLSFNIDLIVNTNIQEFITITNLLSSSLYLPVSQEGLDGMIILPSSISFAGGETKNLNVVFVALNETGIFTGKIKIGNREVLVSINVKEKLLLFDSKITVLNKGSVVKQGKNLNTEVTLTPLGDEDRLDVTLNYIIKDFDGNIYVTESETLLIEDEMKLKRDFSTSLLPLGDFVIGLELVYPNGVATSSANFRVSERIPFSIGTLLYYLLMAILICAILLVGLLLQDVSREKEQQQTF
jgi:hypothetical protein